jgi:hypothetical protein
VTRERRRAQASEDFDARVEASAELVDTWEALREAHAPLLARFYQARPLRGGAA